MNKQILGTVLLAATLGFSSMTAVQAAPEKFTLDSAHAYPYFEINHLGWSTMRGFFRKVAGTATLDFAAKQGSAEITIDATSLDTGDAKRNEHLSGEDFFNVAKYPTITFKSDKLTFDGDKLTKADGQLTLHGVTKPITLTFTQFKCGDHPLNKKYYCAGDATATLKRSDFGMTAYPTAVGEQVKLSIEVEAAREAKSQ
ncbi:MAG: YceI family protein [Candidatus Competibacteraceae bacterium]